jgi:hypothetical protein
VVLRHMNDAAQSDDAQEQVTEPAVHADGHGTHW